MQYEGTRLESKQGCCSYTPDSFYCLFLGQWRSITVSGNINVLSKEEEVRYRDIKKICFHLPSSQLPISNMPTFQQIAQIVNVPKTGRKPTRIER